jgi:hypothetical protein
MELIRDAGAVIAAPVSGRRYPVVGTISLKAAAIFPGGHNQQEPNTDLPRGGPFISGRVVGGQWGFSEYCSTHTTTSKNRGPNTE